MKAFLSMLIALTAFSAMAQSRRNDPCYAYSPEELEAQPESVCSHMRGGSPSRRQEPRGRNESPSNAPRRVSRPAVPTADIIAVARGQGVTSSNTPAQHREALNIAKRLHRRAISLAEAEISKGKRVSGVNMEMINEAELVLNALKGARLVDGAEACGVRSDGQASVSPYGGNEIFICPALILTRSNRSDRDKEIIFILMHEASHLTGLMKEEDADEVAEMILGYSLGG